MASRAEFDVSPLILDELSCCVCRELLREPKILSCAHTVCAVCLSSMVEYEFTPDDDFFALHRPVMIKVVRCPICRQSSAVSDNGVESFPTNYLVKSLVELHSGLADAHHIKTKITQSKALLEQVRNTAANIEETMKIVQEKKEAIALNINQVFESLIERLRERQDELIECCSNKAAARLRDLRHQKQHTMKVESIMKETINRLELSMGSMADVIRHQETILDELSQLEMFEVVNEPVVFSDFNFAIEGDQEIMNRISELGDIQTAFEVPVLNTPVAVPSIRRGIGVVKVIEGYETNNDNDQQGSLSLPWGVTTKSTDAMMIADHVNNRVLMFDQAGNFLSCYAEDHNISLPTSIAVDEVGNILVLDSGNHCIKELNSSGELVWCIGKRGTGEGEIGERAEGLTVDYAGRVIIADTGNNRVQVFYRNGRFALKFGDTGKHCLSRPSCAVYHKGKFVVSDTHNHCLKFYDRNGLFKRQVGLPGKENGQFRQPRGLTVDGNDHILVCDSGNHRVQIFDFSGNFITSFGSIGSEEGQFQFPYAIAITSQGHMVVTDCTNNRVQILRFESDER